MSILNEDFFDLLFVYDNIHSNFGDFIWDSKNINVYCHHLVSNVGITMSRVIPHFKTITITTNINDEPIITHDYRKEPWKLWSFKSNCDTKYIPMMPMTTIVQCALRLTENEWKQSCENIKKLSFGLSQLIKSTQPAILNIKDAYTFIAYENDRLLSRFIVNKLLNSQWVFSKFYREYENEKFFPTLEAFKKRLEYCEIEESIGLI